MCLLSMVRVSKAALRLRTAALLPLALLLAGLSGCGSKGLPSPAGNQLHLQGVVHGGQQPVANSTIQLYAVGSGGDGTASTPLLTTTVQTDSLGGFTITGDYTCPVDNPEVYLVATGGNPGLAASTDNTALVMMAALGACNALTPQTFVSMNEVTTVASILTLAPFMTSYDHIASGSADGTALANAFTQIAEIVNVASGTSPGPAAPPTGYAVPVAEINSLADALAACVNSSGPSDHSPCSLLFQYATPPGSTVQPSSIADALLNIAKNPTLNLANLFNLQSASPPFQPVLAAAPTDWNVAPIPMITLTAATSPVGVDGSATGAITLGASAPVGGLTIDLVSSDTTAVTLPASVTVAAGQTNASFAYTGVSGKAATITASATDYASGTLAVTATTNILTLGSFSSFVPNQTFSLTLGTVQNVAADTVVTLNLTNPGQEGIINLTTYNNTVTIPAGTRAPTTLPQLLTGNVGSVTITATANGYASASTTITVAETASLPSNVNAQIGTTNQLLSISSPAPPAGIAFTLASSAPAVATVPSSVTIPSGAMSVNIPITGIATGHTTIAASATGIAPVSTIATVSGVITSQDQITGIHMTTYGSFSINQQLTGSTTFTVTSNNPNVVTVAKDGVTRGTAAVSFNLTGGGSDFTLQGQAIGSTTVTISAPGYASAIANVSVYPSGFYFASVSNSTTTFSGAQNVQFSVAALDPQTLSPVGNGVLNPELQPVNLTVASSNTIVGTVSAPTFTNQTYAYGSFMPAGAGTTTLSLVQPSGFTASSYAPTQTFTVTQPQLRADSVTTGVHAQTARSFDLGIAPPSPVTATVTIADPTIALLTTDPTQVGTTSVSYPNLSYSGTNLASGARQFWVQGQKLGTTMLTVSAPGYAPAVWVVTVNTAGFSYNFNGQVNVPAYGQQATGTLNLVVQDQYQYTYAVQLNPDYGAVNVALTSSDVNVGTTSTASFGVAAGSAPITFTSGSKTGTTTLGITEPAGFADTTYSPTVVATVVPAPIVTSGYFQTGIHLETLQGFNLPGTPPAPVVVTVSAGSAAVLLSKDPTVVGSSTLQFTVSDTSVMSFYLQGETLGSAQITFSSPGFANMVVTAGVHASTLQLCCNNDDSNVNVYPPIALTITVAILEDGGLSTYGIPVLLAPDAGTLNLTATNKGEPDNGTMRPVNMVGGQASVSTFFDVIAAPVSETDVYVVEPPGFSAPVPFFGYAALIFTQDLGVKDGDKPGGGK